MNEIERHKVHGYIIRALILSIIFGINLLIIENIPYFFKILFFFIDVLVLALLMAVVPDIFIDVLVLALLMAVVLDIQEIFIDVLVLALLMAVVLDIFIDVLVLALLMAVVLDIQETEAVK